MAAPINVSEKTFTSDELTISSPPQISELAMPPRLLLGPGPSNADPRVHQAFAAPQVGHLDPAFLHCVEEIKELLRYAWQTENAFTIPVSGTGSAAWEACLANLLEPNDRILCCVNGFFGDRKCEIASRYGADVRRIEKLWGEVFTLEELRAALEEHRPHVLGIVHAETSTGSLQPLEGLGELCREFNCLLLVDTVTSLAGVPLLLDQWGIDAAYSGGQKCLGCPPGASPITFGPRAMEKILSRSTKVANWYLDMTLIQQYLVVEAGSARTYHHTAPISMMYAIREALRLVAEEGLPQRWRRHRENAELLWKGLEDMGLELHVPPEHRLPSLTTVKIPEGIDGKAVTTFLLNEYNIEIGNGLGQLAGKVWRIGLMGFNSRKENVLLVISALKDALSRQGFGN